MGRSPCCSKDGLNRGAWTASEDKILTAYINSHGEGKWRNLPKRAGLKRCGKSCRLRWLNYLRPGIKRGNITPDEEELIIRLHRLLGNRWSLIAGRLPGRTDNEIKNYWNTTLAKKAKAQSSATPSFKKQPSTKSIRASDHKPALKVPSSSEPAASATQPQPQAKVIQTKASRCTKVLISTSFNSVPNSTTNSFSVSSPSENQARFANDLEENHHLLEDYSPEDNCLCYGSDAFQLNTGADFSRDFYLESSNMCIESLPIDELMVKEWTATATDALENNGAMDLDSLASLLDSESWPQL